MDVSDSTAEIRVEVTARLKAAIEAAARLDGKSVGIWISDHLARASAQAISSALEREIASSALFGAPPAGGRLLF
jgi:hypothetical protein